MSYPNPNYDPSWKSQHDFHVAERDQARQKMASLLKIGQMGSNSYERACAQAQKHQAECQAAVVAQFKTVQDYASWMVQSFSLTMGLHDFCAVVPDVNFERFLTIKEFDATWSRVQRLVAETTDERKNSLATGQPKGMTAFADAASPYLAHGRQKFMPRELFPTGYVGAGGVWAVVTTDKQADGQHICFTRRWGRPGISVANAIERLITAIYREESAKQFAPDPSRLHFYEHITPASSGEFKESFARVALSFEDGEFRKPQWQLYYPVIPKAIRSARFGLALIEAMAITELSR